MRTDSNPALSFSSVSEDVLSSLHRSVSRFVDVDETVAGREDAYHLVAERLHRVCFDILRCERAGYSREDIIDVMAAARENWSGRVLKIEERNRERLDQRLGEEVDSMI